MYIKDVNRPKDSMETSIFLQRVKEKWGKKYTFDICEQYIKRNEPIEGHCEKHNKNFYVNPRHYIERSHNNCGCDECNKEKRNKKNKDDYIHKFVNRWGEGYTFDKLDYIDWRHSGIITCKEHGDFILDEIRHALDKKSKSVPCPICNEIFKKEERNKRFIQLLTQKYGDTYTWITTNFGNYCTDRVWFICPIHGKVSQTLSILLNTIDEDNFACPKCKKDRSNLKQSYTVDSALNKAKSFKCCKYYDFSNITKWYGVKYKYSFKCIKHGVEFEQTFDSLFSNKGNGCPICQGEAISKAQSMKPDEFIQRSKEIHGNKYDYSKVEYVDYYTPVTIICHKHGKFLQRPCDHLNGCGCQKCHRSHLEEQVCVFLDKKNINYNTEVSVRKLTNINGKKGKPQRIDVYIPDKKICIECQGIQHFTYSDKMKITSEEKLKKNIEYDSYKYESLIQNGYDVIYYFPQSFLDYGQKEWYSNKKCFHTLDDLYEYIISF